MQRKRRTAARIAGAVTSAAAVLVAASPAGASAAGCRDRAAAHGQSGQAGPVGADSLNGVAATSPANAWAVGSRYFSAHGGVFLTLVEHWDGGAWKVVPSPNPGGTTTLPGENILNAVTATSPASAWAVGTYSTHGSKSGTLVERWDGASWKQVPSPNPAGSQTAMLAAVTAISPANAWAAGDYTANGGEHALIEHWDGAGWKQVPSPNLPDSSLSGVAATSPGNAWVVGRYMTSAPGVVHTLIEHWDGASWTQVPSPSPGGTGTSNLFALTATSPTSAWAVGFSATKPLTFRNNTLIEKWNGRKWQQAATPGRAVLLNELAGVAAASRASAWAVGGFVDKKRKPHTLIEHWDGATWKTVRSPIPAGALAVNLTGVAVVSASSAWSVGNFIGRDRNSHTLIVAWNGTGWQQVASPSP